MEVDTGSSVSVVGEETSRRVNRPWNSVQLQTYTGETIPVCGSALVPIEHNGQMLTLPLIVVEGNRPLLGRDWLSALRLDWKTIFSVRLTLSLSSKC